MDEDQKRKILSFLSRCQNEETSQTTSIARYLGLDGRCVLSLLRQMESGGLVKKTGKQWRLCREGLPPVAECGATGDHQTEVVSPVAAANQLPGLTKVRGGRVLSTGQPEFAQTDDDDGGVSRRLSTLDVEDHRRRFERTAVKSVCLNAENRIVESEAIQLGFICVKTAVAS